MTETTGTPVVLRMTGLWPKDLGGYEGHRTRKGGDLGHVDKTRSKDNRRLLGSVGWAREVQDEVREMATENFADELDKLKRRRRKSELHKRITEGPRDPWRATQHGPMREVILTVNRKWFEAGNAKTSPETRQAAQPTAPGFQPIDELFGDEGEARALNRHEAQFEELAVAWLQEHFGEDVVHARADLDEEAYHIHAVILPRARTKDGRHMLQPSKHAMIEDYELAQDSVGAWFSQIGLVRGEKRAKAIRDAIEKNATRRGDAPKVDVPEKRQHVSPRDWRRKEERKLSTRASELETREGVVAQRESEADEVLDLATAVASGDIDLVERAEAPSNEEPASESGPSPKPASEKPASPRLQKARTLFRKALARLRGEAQEAARRSVARDVEEIRKADDTIVEIASKLPSSARETIAGLRKGLTKRLLGLRHLDQKGGRDQADRDES
ncbi:plasmid recombination protein [Roseivivax sp. THAF30]|uniref:plasmid recombination protein n=1 Tax=Roseivivax sp. THAF30 TaxID=2587852 RepID=UPI001268F472|nr:plasmid recombination protein [Roseivivax sp. THAF30]QFT61565.1 Plasmid recombination enzyme [Roseivivax sp. THAF30]